jgi:TfoX/Sxy family transcriptional regulator of competence genes
VNTPPNPATLRARLEELAPGLPFEITIRPMMGGYIGYADGRTFVSISTGGFGVKLLPADQDRLLARPGATRMRHSPSEPESKTYITLPPQDLGNDELALEWLTLAANTAPAGKRRPATG